MHTVGVSFPLTLLSHLPALATPGDYSVHYCDERRLLTAWICCGTPHYGKLIKCKLFAFMPSRLVSDSDVSDCKNRRIARKDAAKRNCRSDQWDRVQEWVHYKWRLLLLIIIIISSSSSSSSRNCADLIDPNLINQSRAQTTWTGLKLLLQLSLQVNNLAYLLKVK